MGKPIYSRNFVGKKPLKYLDHLKKAAKKGDKWAKMELKERNAHTPFNAEAKDKM